MSTAVSSQPSAGKMSFVNKKCPDFTFFEIDHYKKEQASLSDFKGKWLIIDFWSQYCSSCVNSMPKMSAIQQQFKDSIQIIMVGIYGQTTTSNIRSTRDLFEKIKANKNLSLAVAYDTTFSKEMKVGGLPDILVIDPDGFIRVRGRTINPELLKKIMSGNFSEVQDRVIHFDEAQKNAPKYDPAKPFLTDGNGGDSPDFLYRSLISRSDSFSAPYNSIISNGRVELLKLPLQRIYMYAFFRTQALVDEKRYEKYYRNPILEVKDSSFFYSEDKLEKSYSYSLIYPQKKINGEFNPHVIEDDDVLKIIQRDLEIAFPFKASIEVRMKPYYKLVADKDAIDKIRAKGKESTMTKPWGRYRGVVYTNVSISAIVGFFMGDSYGYNWKVPIIDNTGIREKIDIEIIGFTFEEQRKSLKKYGLDLVLDEKPTACLVIRDKDR